MNFHRTAIITIGTALICAVGTGLASGQAAAPRSGQGSGAERAELAEQRFKNVQILKGISVQEFMETMGFFAAATNMTCAVCHGEESAASWDNYAADPPLKQKARMMMVMVDSINRSYFGGKRQVTCYTCHRVSETPRVTPSLVEQYATPLPEDPDDISEQASGAPTPQQVLDKYLQAVGGAQKVATFTSFAAKGAYQNYDDPQSTPVELYAKAPGRFFQVDHGRNGDRIWVDDGKSAWVAEPQSEVPVPVTILAGGDLEGLHLESQLYFPERIRQLLTNLRVGLPVSGAMSLLSDKVGTGIDDRELTVMQGSTAGGNRVRLYFDSESGLLVRMVRYTNLPFGFITTEMDYTDYRDVAGFKIPFRITKTWVDGRSVTELNSVQVNVPVDAAKFSKPAAPK